MRIGLWIKSQLGRASRPFKLICDSHIIFPPTYLEREFSGERSVIFPYAVSLDCYDHTHIRFRGDQCPMFGDKHRVEAETPPTSEGAWRQPRVQPRGVTTDVRDRVRLRPNGVSSFYLSCRMGSTSLYDRLSSVSEKPSYKQLTIMRDHAQPWRSGVRNLII